MNTCGLYLHICSCQSPGHSICQHGPSHVQGLRGLVGANTSSEQPVGVSGYPKGWVPGRETRASLGEGVNGPRDPRATSLPHGTAGHPRSTDGAETGSAVPAQEEQPSPPSPPAPQGP